MTREIGFQAVCAALGISLALCLIGCAGPKTYNSLDLALLPCEMGAPSNSFAGEAPRFFRAVEFDEEGKPLFSSQISDLRARFEQSPITDLVFFIHGWNKNPSSAESDYQNFLCRFHAHLPTAIGDEKRAGGLVVVGIFWPSTITNGMSDPLTLKILSYYRIRDRADLIAQTGLTELLEQVAPLMAQQGRPPRLQLVGHSMGGRMLVRSMETLNSHGTLVPLLQAAQSVDLVLLNAAVAPARFEWLEQAVKKARADKMPARFTEDTNSYLFNVHSFNDSANRVLFPTASLFDDDESVCAVGACGVPAYPTLCVDDSGSIQGRELVERSGGARINAWNVDATKIIFEHTDIYKGRVAQLLATLVFDEEQKRRFPIGNVLTDPKSRCG